MIKQDIQKILDKLRCNQHTYNPDNHTIEVNYHSGSSTYGLQELVDIIDELKNNQINYSVDENENIKIETK